jgi:tripartite-type tricarboxylate transporter receptor subunit TctC
MRKLLAFVLAGFFVAGVGPSRAQDAGDYPSKPIHIIVPYVAGGGGDIFARRLLPALSKELGTEIVVENRGGAGGNIGMQAAAAAAPDGYTIVFALSAQLALNATMYPNKGWDAIEDFEPITYLAWAPYVLVTNPSVPAKTVQELIDLEKATPGTLSFASPGIGSPPHLAGAQINKIAGIEMQHIPYQGGGAVYPDLLAGRVSMYFATLSSSAGHIKDGKLNLIATGAAKRPAVLPDLPTVAETLPGIDVTVWYGVLAPKGTPRPIVDKLNKAFIAAINDPEVAKILAADAVETVASTPEELAAHITEEIAKWAPIIKDSGATLN